MSVSKRVFVDPSRLPATERAIHCTHLQLTRLFDEYGCEKCSICHRRPQLGWLYRCTQDSYGFLPAADFFDAGHDKQLECDAQLYTLQPSIIEAAQRGDYTDQELDILWKQKIEVRRSIQQIRPTTSSTVSTASSSLYSLPPSTTTSTIPPSDCEPSTRADLSQSSELLSYHRGPLEPIQESRGELETDNQYLLFAKANRLPPCNFKVCQNCRPTYRERAWQSINGIVKLPYKVPPRHEMHNRRVSDLQIVRTLGMGKRREGQEPGKDVDDNRTSSKANFQETVQKLLKNREAIKDTEEPILHRTDALKNLARFARPSSTDSSSSGSSTDSSFSHPRKYQAGSKTSNLCVPPLFARRGFERLATIQAPPRSAISLSGESSSSAALSTDHSNVSSPAVLGLKIDVAMANQGRDDISLPQKTPTDSLKESLKRFGITGKSQARFLID